MKRHPLVGRFEAVLKRDLDRTTAWNGVTFRSVELAYGKPEHILSGEGGWRAGGRWNVPRLLRVVYSSLRPGAAAEEAFALAGDFGLSRTALRPRVIVGIRWRLPRVLDLVTNPPPEASDLPAWLEEDFRKINQQGFETTAQAFGCAAWQAGLSGLLVPSARIRGAINLVAFNDAFQAGRTARVLRAAELEEFLK